MDSKTREYLIKKAEEYEDKAREGKEREDIGMELRAYYDAWDLYSRIVISLPIESSDRGYYLSKSKSMFAAYNKTNKTE